MDMQASRQLAVTQQQAWDALNDPEVLKLCIPGCDKVEATEPGPYVVGVAVKIGPVSAKFNGKITLGDMNPPSQLHADVRRAGRRGRFRQGQGQGDADAQRRWLRTRLHRARPGRRQDRATRPAPGRRCGQEHGRRLLQAFRRRDAAPLSRQLRQPARASGAAAGAPFPAPRRAAVGLGRRALVAVLLGAGGWCAEGGDMENLDVMVLRTLRDWRARGQTRAAGHGGAHLGLVAAAGRLDHGPVRGRRGGRLGLGRLHRGRPDLPPHPGLCAAGRARWRGRAIPERAAGASSNTASPPTRRTASACPAAARWSCCSNTTRDRRRCDQLVAGARSRAADAAHRAPGRRRRCAWTRRAAPARRWSCRPPNWSTSSARSTACC